MGNLWDCDDYRACRALCLATVEEEKKMKIDWTLVKIVGAIVIVVVILAVLLSLDSGGCSCNL